MLSKKTQYINLLYIIGTLLVVLGHSTSHYVGNWGGQNLIDSPTAVIVRDFIYSFHMPLFFMLAGYMFKLNWNKGKYKEFIPFIVKKFNRLIIPYLLVGLLYVAPIKLLVGTYRLDNFIPSVLNNILLGVSPAQLWFLLALFNIFIIYYFFRRLVDKYENNLVVNLLMFGILTIMVLFDLSPNIFQINQTLNYIVYFHLGYILCSNSKFHNLITRRSLPLIFLHILIFVVGRFFNIPLDNFIMSVVGSLAIYSFAFNNVDKLDVVINSKVYNLVGKYTLEIYLFHQQIILLLLLPESFRELHPIIVIISTFTISIIISLILAIIINNIKKWLGQKVNFEIPTTTPR